MTGAPTPPLPPVCAWPRLARLAPLLLALAALAAWHNSFQGPFILDDLPAIPENPTLRSLWPPAGVLQPPGDGQTVTGRPLVNLSLALNWAATGERVWSYHAANLAIHFLAACALFGVARRTFRSAPLAARCGAGATPLAFALALLWLVHPLQTESVTYIVQRAESLVGLWLLLALYAAIRGFDAPAPARWHALAVVSALAGMATKEVMFAAPMLVWLHDRTFLAGSFGAALRRRPLFYAALASTWLLLGALVWHTGTRGATAGFGLGISPWHYLLTQCSAIVHYVRLVVWPAPLVLDYGFSVVKSPAEVWPQAALLVAAGLGTLVAVVRRSPWGFPGAWFFLLLGPSSSILPVATQTIAEHRMYLPLAAVLAVPLVLAHAGTGRRAGWLLAAVALASVTLTVRRNTDYRSALAIWHDTAVKRPLNARAHQEFALALFRGGRAADSLPHFVRALELEPGYGKGRHNYAGALADSGRLDEAAAQYQRLLADTPDFVLAHYGLGNVRRLQGRRAEALACYEAALRLEPAFAPARNNAALLLSEAGQLDAALVHFEAAARARPDLVEARFNLANALARAGRPAEAIPHYETVLRLQPANVDARENLGVVFVMAGRIADGVRELEAAQRLAPDRASIATNLATARARLPAR